MNINIPDEYKTATKENDPDKYDLMQEFLKLQELSGQGSGEVFLVQTISV